MCQMYKTKFWGSAQIIPLIKNNFKIKIYYSDWILYKEMHNVEESTVSVFNVVVLISVAVNSFFMVVEERVIWLCLAAWRLSGFGVVRKQFSDVASFSRQQRCVCRIELSLSFITPKWIKTGMNVIFGWGRGILDWFKNMWAQILCIRFWSFFLECSKLFLLLIGLKIWEHEFYVHVKKIYATNVTVIAIEIGVHRTAPKSLKKEKDWMNWNS